MCYYKNDKKVEVNEHMTVHFFPKVDYNYIWIEIGRKIESKTIFINVRVLKRGRFVPVYEGKEILG